jgi:hypothetical protein
MRSLGKCTSETTTKDTRASSSSVTHSINKHENNEERNKIVDRHFVFKSERSPEKSTKVKRKQETHIHK